MNTELTYRQTYASGASPIGSMIALYDTLVGDIRRAAEAVRANDIETRCREVNHALLVIGHLHNLLDTKNGGESALVLEEFFSRLRLRLSEASIKKSAAIFEDQIAMILQVRTSWQKLDSMPLVAQETLASGNNEEQVQTTSVVEECARFSLSI